MSGNLRLYGATSGYSQISAPDVAGDQIFVVPSLGGEVIVSGNNQSLDLGTGDLTVDNITANSLTLPTAPVVGYQQGTWTPLVVLGTATGDNATWSRIGNLVIVRGRFINFSDTTTGAVIECSAASFPYDPIAPPNTVCIGSCFASNIGRQPTLVSHVTSGGARFTSSAANNSSNILTARHNDIGTSPSLNFTFSYLTADTTWTPNTGATVS